jgi:hypothetical protein
MNGLPCQDAELKAKKYGVENPLKTLEKLGCEKYAMTKIMRVNMVIYQFEQYVHYKLCSLIQHPKIKSQANISFAAEKECNLHVCVSHYYFTHLSVIVICSYA